MDIPPSIDVVNRQEFKSCFATTGALASIVGDGFLADALEVLAPSFVDFIYQLLWAVIVTCAVIFSLFSTGHRRGFNSFLLAPVAVFDYTLFVAKHTNMANDWERVSTF